MAKIKKSSSPSWKNACQFGIILLAFAIGLFGGQYIYFSQQQDKIALLPSDSRPCNTQYLQVLATVANLDLTLPDSKDLDDFRTPSSEDKLWRWLEEAAENNDCLIIYTNQLFQGGLIASHKYQNYANTDSQLIRLENFCREYQDKEIIVVSILPRLKPSQYDDELWEHQAALTEWAKTSAQAIAENGVLAEIPENVPQKVVDDYLALYKEADKLTEGLVALAEKDFIDHLIIGQDDAEEWSFSNLIYQKIAEQEQDNISTIHGADELSMLILANKVAQEPLPVRIIYTNPAKLTEYYPYEAADLETIVAVKLAFAGLVESPTAQDVIIIHNDPEKSEYVTQLLAKEKGHYIGLADIAYTNRGSYQLKDTLFSLEYFDRISCYSGWNTASNSLGTVFAHYRLSQYGSEQYPSLNTREKEEMLKALMTFKSIRYNEDQIYQAHIAPQLNPLLLEQKMIDGYGVFLQNSKPKASVQLEQHYASYQQEFAHLINGRHQIYFAGQNIPFVIKDYESMIAYPWNRTFEVKADCNFELSL